MKKRIYAKIFLLSFFLLSVIGAETVKAQKKVACIGDSITEGAGTSNPATQAYPAQLGGVLGSGFTVSNFGVSGTTMLKAGDNPYWNQTAFTNAKTSNPDIVVIQLGTNDSKPWNWDNNKSSYISDYKAMIDVFQALESKPEIYVCLPAKAFSSAYEISEDNLANEIRPAIIQMAKEKKVSLIDLYDATKNASADIPDGVHPNDAGAALLATKVKDILTQTVGSITRVGDVLTAPGAETYRWYINNEPVNNSYGGNSSSITAYATGDYTVSLKLAADKEDRILTNPLTVSSVSTSPVAPSNVLVAPGNATNLVSWDKVLGASGYRVKYALTSGGAYTDIGLEVTNNSFLHTGLANGTAYYYIVTAINSNGESIVSTEVSGTPLASLNSEPGQGYYFTGANTNGVHALIDNPHADGQPGPFDFSNGTIEGWIRPDFDVNGPEQDPFIFSMIQWWGVRWGIRMGKDYNSIGVLGANDETSYLVYKFEKGQWYHIAAVFNASGNVTVYINGVSIGTSTSKVNFQTTGTPFKIGISWSWSGDHLFKGAVDEVRIWDVVRSETEIRNNMNTPVSPSSTGLLSYYKFSQAATGVLPDLTANALHGNIGFWENDNLTKSSPNWVESYAMVVPRLQTATGITQTAFTINWQTPLIGTADSYIMDIATDESFNDLVTGYSGLDVGNVNSKEITGLTANTPYYYRIRANKTSVAGQGAYSVTASVTTENTLPLNFVAFTANKGNNAINLKWQTADEINNSHFNVLHSKDGISWNIIARVDAKGLASNSYNYEHLNPSAGNNYYQLQQVDINNDFTYSEIKTVDFMLSGSSVTVYPNPVSETLNVQLPSQSKEKNYTIYSIAGVKIKQGKISSSKPSINISNFIKGIYFIQIDGEMVAKFIKQ